MKKILAGVGRFVNALLNPPEGHIAKQLDASFDRAKRISDFIGLFVNLVFSVFFYTFCFASTGKNYSYFENAGLGTLGVISFIVSMALFSSICSMCFHYFWQDVEVHKHLVTKAIIIVLMTNVYFTLTITIWNVANQIAHLTKTQ